MLNTNQSQKGLDSVPQTRPTPHRATLDESLGLSEMRVTHRMTLDLNVFLDQMIRLIEFLMIFPFKCIYISISILSNILGTYVL